MKKIIALAIATSMCVMMIGCSGKAEPEAATTNPEAEASTEAGTDLMDFMGSPVEEACAAVEGLEKDGDQYSAREEKSMDGLSLAGPFIDVDANGIVTGITYSGEKYCVETLWVGTSMEYSGQFLKDLGWEFRNVDFAHGTAQYVVTYAKDNMELILVSDEAGDFDKSEESDVTGCVATISVYNK